LTPGGSSTSHIYTQTVHIIQRKENWEVRAVFASYTLAFALQLRKKHGKTSVRVPKYKNNEAHNTRTMNAQYKNSATVTRTINSKCHRTTKNTEYTTQKTVHYR
jgi:hypothetical protein